MDEYDVFLDEMSRKITLDAIMDYALRPEFRNIQFFILTPHTLKLVTSKDIRIQSMPGKLFYDFSLLSHVLIINAFIYCLATILFFSDPPRNTARGLQQATIGEEL